MVDPRVVADLARGHPPGVQADDHRVQSVHPPLALAHQARRERAGPVPGHHWSRRGPPRSRWSWSWCRCGRCRGPMSSALPSHSPGARSTRPAGRAPGTSSGQSGEQPPGPGHHGPLRSRSARTGRPGRRSRATAEPHRARRRACSSPQSQSSVSVLPSGLTQTIEHAQPRFVRASFRRHQEYQPRPGGNGPGPWPAGRDMSGPVRPRPRAVISAYHRLCGIEKSLAHVQVRPESTPHLPSPTPVHRGPPNLTQALNNIHHDTE